MASDNDLDSSLYQEIVTLAKLQSEQIRILLEKIDTLTANDQERHNNLKEEIDLMKVTREAEATQMVEFEQKLDRLEETTVALMNITSDLQPVVQTQTQQPATSHSLFQSHNK